MPRAYLLFKVYPTLDVFCNTFGEVLLTVTWVLELVKDGKYQVRMMTRDLNSRRAKELAALPGVELFKGTFASEDDLTNGFTGCDGAVSYFSFLSAVLWNGFCSSCQDFHLFLIY